MPLRHGQEVMSDANNKNNQKKLKNHIYKHPRAPGLGETLPLTTREFGGRTLGGKTGTGIILSDTTTDDSNLQQ